MTLDILKARNEENHGPISVVFPGVVSSGRSTAFRGLLQKCYSVISDFDPVMQLMAFQVSAKIREGARFDKHMIFLAGAIAMLVFEEFM